VIPRNRRLRCFGKISNLAPFFPESIYK